MKHRERIRLTMSNVKQEDQKHAAFTHAQSSIEVNTNTTATVGLTIKQEESKDHKVPSKQHGIYGEKDYYYRCDICKQRSPDLKSVLEHRRSIHVIRRFSNTKIKNLDEEPDVHDPNSYCKACGSGYNNARKYKNHLRSVHYMVLKPMPKWETLRNDTVPDPNDPNLYCRACDHTYKHMKNYKQHCRYAHGLNPVKLANQSPSSSSVTDSYCQACDRRLASIRSYRRHLFLIHKVDSRSIQKEQNDILPNVNDPNFYCRSCSKTLSSKYNYRYHLAKIHNIGQVPYKKTKGEPDINDPNHYCRICQRTLASRRSYRNHLQVVHHLSLLPHRDPNMLPDPLDPNFHCSVCDKTIKTRHSYRYHCSNVHRMALTRSSVSNPNAAIDINHPDHYCAQCDHYYSSMQLFGNHLHLIHDLYPSI